MEGLPLKIEVAYVLPQATTLNFKMTMAVISFGPFYANAAILLPSLGCAPIATWRVGLWAETITSSDPPVRSLRIQTQQASVAPCGWE